MGEDRARAKTREDGANLKCGKGARQAESLRIGGYRDSKSDGDGGVTGNRDSGGDMPSKFQSL